MKVFITGGAGLLGSHLIAALQERGADIRVLALPGERTAHLEARNVEIVRGDVRELEMLAPAVQGAELVYHLAGMMGLWRPMADYHAVNVTGTENVCRAALAAGVRRLVHVSSWTVYGMNLGRPAREDFPLRPFHEPYAVTKTDGDLVVQRMIAQDKLPAVIVRPGTFFGPGDQLHFGRMADRVYTKNGIVVGSGRNALPFVYVTDVVQGLLLAGEQQAAVGRAYNITNDAPMTQEGFLQAIAEELGVSPPRTHIPYAALYSAAAVIERAAYLQRAKQQPIVTRLGVKLFGSDNRHSIERARAELGYSPQISIREGVRLASAWYREKTTTTPAPATPVRA